MAPHINEKNTELSRWKRVQQWLLLVPTSSQCNIEYTTRPSYLTPFLCGKFIRNFGGVSILLVSCSSHLHLLSELVKVQLQLFFKHDENSESVSKLAFSGERKLDIVVTNGVMATLEMILGSMKVHEPWKHDNAYFDGTKFHCMKSKVIRYILL